MDNPPSDERTIINVKGISVNSYDRAKNAANKAGETVGSWLSRAMDQLANLEAGERYIPAAPQANPPATPVVDLREVAAVLMAMKEAGLPVQKRVGRQVNALLYGRLRGGEGRLALPFSGED